MMLSELYQWLIWGDSERKITGIGLAQREGERHSQEVWKMHFIFGYSREVEVKIKRNPSKAALVGLAILIILLLIFLSFENLDGEVMTTQFIFNGESCSPQGDQVIPSDVWLNLLFDSSSWDWLTLR